MDESGGGVCPFISRISAGVFALHLLFIVVSIYMIAIFPMLDFENEGMPERVCFFCAFCGFSDTF